ncbi:bifunctional serine/threonine-protein kinase/universal stress protein [Chitinivorax sp. B]|uniref:bifunctional serine/threonine-protein kinase/universal stress protein n=1 Tax=Chitinivorax sp. B TaxID=2502235 RepID=UPI0010F9324F|nr:bifunctional serine/threonine-protein kinase/universal stress protein [Chitinivorax sp. B]
MAPVTPVAGMTIDGFRLKHKLHQGGMATIWQVTHPDFELPLVMKVPRIHPDDDPTGIVGFEVEQMILPRLNGSHVPRCVAEGDFAHQPYIVMEYLGDNALSTHLHALPLSIDEVADMGRRIADGLHCLHQQHVIHLDIKPSNILLRDNSDVVFVDFGLARHDHLPDLLAEEFNLPLGTGPYISPEQVLRVRNDPRSDLFALGVILYYLTTGQQPFGFPTTIPGLKRRLYRDPIPPVILNPQCPPWLQEIILRCLAIDPAQRWATAAELALMLANPAQVPLSLLAEKRQSDSLGIVAKRWFRSLGAEASAGQSAENQVEHAPILMVAVDLSPGMIELADRLRHTTRRILEIEPGARLACVTVVKSHRLSLDLNEDEHGQNLHVQRLIELKHWAHPLELGVNRITFHVLSHPDPAAALIDYARQSHVDHIVMGARGGRGAMLCHCCKNPDAGTPSVIGQHPAAGVSLIQDWHDRLSARTEPRASPGCQTN